MATTVRARPQLLIVLAAVLTAAAASLALHARDGTLDTLTGRTAASSPVVVTLRGGHAERFIAGSTEVRCADGWSFAVPPVRGTATERSGRLRGSGSRHIRYPDGEPGVAVQATLNGSLRPGRAAGTVAYAVDLYRAGRVTNRCVAPPVRFSVR
jgi:hypothetical protein